MYVSRLAFIGYFDVCESTESHHTNNNIRLTLFSPPNRLPILIHQHNNSIVSSKKRQRIKRSEATITTENKIQREREKKNIEIVQVIGTAEYGTVQHSQRATLVNKSEKKVTIRFKCPFELVYICSSILSYFFLSYTRYLRFVGKNTI